MTLYIFRRNGRHGEGDAGKIVAAFSELAAAELWGAYQLDPLSLYRVDVPGDRIEIPLVDKTWLTSNGP